MISSAVSSKCSSGGPYVLEVPVFEVFWNIFSRAKLLGSAVSVDINFCLHLVNGDGRVHSCECHLSMCVCQ